MTTRLTTLGTLQYSSFGGIKLFPAKAASTTSSTLDNLQLDITLRNQERISEFFLSLPLALPFLTQEPPQRTDAFGGKEEGEVAAQKKKKRCDENSPFPPYLKRRHRS